MAGPLRGIRVVEFAGVGPAPFCAMVLADLGADVVRLDRPPSARYPAPDMPLADVLQRGRRSVVVDLKHPEGAAAVRRLIAGADVLLEGFRPGVMERLGFGPEACAAANPRLVYGRMTGWGQSGPLARAAGHDLNYIALAGCLAHLGRRTGKPIAPLNLLGDFGGGGMLLAVGVLAALVERGASGLGQLVDAAMVDGSALLMTMIHGMRAVGAWSDQREANLLDGGAPFYDTYECADGRYVSVAAIEPPFYAELLRATGLADEALPEQMDRRHWAALRERLSAVFRTKTRDEWCRLMEGTDVCFAPVLTMEEAPGHPHNLHRKVFVEVGGIVQPAPAPRFGRTPASLPHPPPKPGADTAEVLADWGFEASEVERLREAGAVS